MQEACYSCYVSWPKVTIHTELIDQLQKWHHLMESGAISESEYKELQQTILCDIKQL